MIDKHCRSCKLPTGELVALSPDQITPGLATNVREYVHMWRESAKDGPYMITRDNLFDILVELYCDAGRISDPHSNTGLLEFGCMEFVSRRDWLRDTFFLPGPVKPTNYVHAQAKERFRFIASVIAAHDPLGAYCMDLMPDGVCQCDYN